MSCGPAVTWRWPPSGARGRNASLSPTLPASSAGFYRPAERLCDELSAARFQVVTVTEGETARPWVKILRTLTLTAPSASPLGPPPGRSPGSAACTDGTVGKTPGPAAGPLARFRRLSGQGALALAHGVQRGRGWSRPPWCR